MKIDFSDIFITTEKKPKMISLQVTEADFENIQNLKRAIGKTTVAEIMRRSIRVGMQELKTKVDEITTG